MTELCKVCNTRPPHGYVNGTGEYLRDTCLPCYRRSRKQPNFLETNSSKRGSRVMSNQGKEDQ